MVRPVKSGPSARKLTPKGVIANNSDIHFKLLVVAMRAHFALFLLAVSFTPHALMAQQAALVTAVTDLFTERCGAALADPSGYISAARNGSAGPQVTVSESDDGSVYLVRDTTPPGEVAISFVQAPGQVLVNCHGSVVNAPVLLDSAAIDAAFVEVMAQRKPTEMIGGPLDLKNLLAGDASMAGMVMQGTLQIYSYAFRAPELPGLDVFVQIQSNLYELKSFRALNQAVALNP